MFYYLDLLDIIWILYRLEDWELFFITEIGMNK